MSNISLPILATSLCLTAFSAFGVGYMMSPPPARTGDSNPIIDPDAWNKTAPVQPGFQNSAPVAVSTNFTRDQDQRGWVDPDDVIAASYQEDTQSADAYDDAAYDGDSGSYSVEQLDGGRDTNTGTSSITVLDNAEADRAWNISPASADASEQPSATPISVSH